MFIKLGPGLFSAPNMVFEIVGPGIPLRQIPCFVTTAPEIVSVYPL